MYRRIFFTTCATRSEALPGKAVFNDCESGLPIFFAIRTERLAERFIKGVMNNNIVYISWQTAAENNTSRFELQRSENGTDFNHVETFMAAGTSKNINRYATTDLIYTFCKDKLYYRLKLVFVNGKEEFTDVITLELSTVAAASVYDLTYNNQQ